MKLIVCSSGINDENLGKAILDLFDRVLRFALSKKIKKAWFYFSCLDDKLWVEH